MEVEELTATMGKYYGARIVTAIAKPPRRWVLKSAPYR